ncbi:MAG: hypothetical protein ACJ8DJ_19515, partial [Gemmatimonadales bacterium]
MSRRVAHLSLAVSLLSALAVVGCSTPDRTQSGSTTATSTTSTGAEPSSSPAASTAPTVSTVVPSYADAERAFHRGRYEEAAGMF